MPCACQKSKTTVDRVTHVLDMAMSIDVGQLERMVEQAHECTPEQMHEPNELFCISRQALRMFWHFRCNLESVEVRPAHE